MNRRLKSLRAIGFLISGFFMFLAISVRIKWPWFVLAFAGEDSPATWLSGTLLILCAGFSINLSLFDEGPFWILVAFGLLILALDEHFFLHERLKSRILFDIFNGDAKRMGIFGEALPIIYCFCGFSLFYPLVRKVHSNISRLLFGTAIILGFLSFVFDIFYINIVWEEILKIFGELTFATGLLMETGDIVC